MKTLDIEELVRSAVARTTRQRSSEIADAMTLRELGLDDADAQELRLRLVKAASPRRLTASKLERALPITPDSTVKAVIAGVRKISPARTAKARGGADLGDPRRHQAQIAVISALSEVSPNVDFSQIRPKMKLGKDLGLDAVAIAEAKIGVLRALPGKEFSKALSAVDVRPSSTVEAVVDQVLRVMSGDVTTGRKGLVAPAPARARPARKDTTSLSRRRAFPAPGLGLAGDINTGKKG